MPGMKRHLLGAFAALALGTLGSGVLGGCGSDTKTVSVAESPPAAQTSATGTTPSTTKKSIPTTTSTTTSPTSTAGGAAAPSTTRTAPEPAFAQGETHAEGVSAAASLLRARGYTPNETSQYHPNQTLRVLLGTRTGSGDGYGQQAFFFLGGRYIGTDTKEPSATIKVVSQNDTEVTLAYPLYRNNDPLSTPSGGQAIVRFQLNNGKLTPIGTIPPANSSTGLARN
jgi:LppP/LprE lipoprotein